MLVISAYEKKIFFCSTYLTEKNFQFSYHKEKKEHKYMYKKVFLSVLSLLFLCPNEIVRGRF